MISWRVAMTLAIAAVIGGCATPKQLDDVQLDWRPTESIGTLGVITLVGTPQQKIEIAPLRMTPSSPQLIGENREEATPLPVTTRDDVAAFVTLHLKQMLSDAGLAITESGGNLILRGEVTSFFVTETDLYRGDVRLRLDLVDPSGRVLWSGIVGGTANHFGRSYKEENYLETLSDSLTHAAFNLMHNGDFEKALSGAHHVVRSR
jgi:hypothetical protein